MDVNERVVGVIQMDASLKEASQCVLILPTVACKDNLIAINYRVHKGHSAINYQDVLP